MRNLMRTGKARTMEAPKVLAKDVEQIVLTMGKATVDDPAPRRK